MTIVEAAPDHRWRRYPPRHPCRRGARSARSPRRHRGLQRRAAGYKALFAWLEDFGEVTGSGSKAPPLWHRVGAVPAAHGCRGRRGEPSEPPVPSPREVRSPRCHRGRPGCHRGRASGSAKSKDGPVEAIRVLVIAKRSARQARVKAIAQMRHLGFTAPEQLHCRLKGMTVTALVAECAGLRPSARRSGDRSHQGVAVVVGPSRPGPSISSWPGSTRRSSRCSSPPSPISSTASGSGPIPRSAL